MKLLVSDTGPLNYLLQTGYVDILPRLFTEVHLTTSVVKELTHSKAPEIVQCFGRELPTWVILHADPVGMKSELPVLSTTDQSVIQLADELKGILLMDETAGRKIAASRGIPCIGTLGILAAASEQQWILFSEAIDRLRKTSIRLPEPVIAEYLKRLS